MKLIVEKPILPDAFEYKELTESVSGRKSLIIQGPMMGAEMVNKNQRDYSLDGMIEAVEIYRENFISQALSVGELNHPERIDINYERATHLITELTRDKTVFYGKAKVLEGHPMGDIVASLVRNGVRVGMSSRALGEIMTLPSGITRVVKMNLRAIDAVSDPSFPTAYVNGIMESTNFVLNADGRFAPVYDNFHKSMETIPTKSNLREEYLMTNIRKFFDELKAQK